MNVEKIFWEFVRWAIVPILLLTFSLSSYNVYKDMKYWFRKHQTPVFFWGIGLNGILFYCAWLHGLSFLCANCEVKL